MVPTKKPIIWHPQAANELFEILEFFEKRNHSRQYSKKLYDKIVKRLNLLGDDCLLGEMTDNENIRKLAVENHSILYWIRSDAIEVLSIRDGRRDVK